MNTREYRLTKIQPGLYSARACYGLMDVVPLDNGMVYTSAKAARDAIKAHAAMAGVKPLILAD